MNNGTVAVIAIIILLAFFAGIGVRYIFLREAINDNFSVNTCYSESNHFLFDHYKYESFEFYDNSNKYKLCHCYFNFNINVNEN